MKHWYSAFKARHPEISRRIAENMSKARLTAQQKEQNIASFFAKLEAFKSLPAEQLYAADETGLDGDGARREEVLAPTGTRRVFQKLESYREHTSILHVGNAAGISHPPVIIFKGKKLDADVGAQIAEHDPQAMYGAQENGYFLAEHSLQILVHFEKYLCASRPVLLIMDGAHCHIDRATAEFALSKQIHILLLPAHTTHILQVADVSLFAPFKHYWKAECIQLKRKRARVCRSADNGIKRGDIVPLMFSAWNRAMTATNIKAGFRRTGIYPFNPIAYKSSITMHARSESINGLPLLLSPASALLSASPAITSVCQVIDDGGLVIPSSTPAKKKVRRMLNTAAGLLLTGPECLRMLAEKAAEKKEEQDVKEAKRLLKVKRREEKREETERKTKKKEEKAAEKAARNTVSESSSTHITQVVSNPLQAEQVIRVCVAETDNEVTDENHDPNLPALPSPHAKAAYTCDVLKKAGRRVLLMRPLR